MSGSEAIQLTDSLGIWLMDQFYCMVLDIYCYFLSSRLYQIAHLGDADDEPEFSSSTPLEEGETF